MTPADLTLLRASMKDILRHSKGGANLDVPYILCIPADGTFCLHAYGAPQAISSDLSLLGTLMLAERLEPGYTRRVLSSATDPETALLSTPQHADRLQTHTNATAAFAQRKLFAYDTSKISLNDLD